ncbi:Neuropeptide receptor A8 [Operophtera brumata]|uniref:Neuropeptide receptor A8 n=1 Tax=Operophtera brumata TaxID=104452 RepID=A0A0L7KNV6_OPEBR|nr:Neuropeptide receptor A8 [Operophtera brumata]
MSNKSQTLLDIFQEILAASGNLSDSGINETQIVSVLRAQASSGNEDLESMLVKMMRDAQSRLAPPPEMSDGCWSYCAGDFREKG